MQRLILFVLTLNLISCATNVPDVPVCFEITMDRGGCIKTISGERFEINEQSKFGDKTWWEMRPAMIQVPPESWAQIKAFIIKICKKSNTCSDNVGSWDRTVDNIDTEIRGRLGQ